MDLYMFILPAMEMKAVFVSIISCGPKSSQPYVESVLEHFQPPEYQHLAK
jgi:hypothetical protein